MPSYQAVVIGVHDSPTGRRAVELAAPLSAETAAKLILVAAYRPTHHPSHGDDPYQESGAGSAQRALAQSERICTRLGVTNVESHAVAGDAVTALTDAVRQHDADLLLVGSHGMSTLSGRLLGSVPSGVTREAHCDVLVVHSTTELWRVIRHPRRRSRSERTVVAGVHESSRSRRAAQRAAQVAADFGAALVLVGAYEKPRGHELREASVVLGADSDVFMGSLPIEGVLGEADAAARALGVNDVKTVVVEGDAMRGLLKVTDEYDADVLVVGNHHLHGRVSRMLGSISEQVSRKTPTHVLLVH